METQSIPYNEQEGELEHKAKLARAKRLLLIVAIGSMVMFFAGLASMHIVTKGGAKYWVEIALPQAFIWSTVLIVASSLSMWLATRAVKQGNQPLLKGLLVVSLLLGIGFIYSQMQGWGELADKGMHMRGDFLENLKGEYGTDYIIKTGPDHSLAVEYRDGHFYDPNDPTGQTRIDEEVMQYRNPAARNLVTLTGLHAVHVMGGILWLVYLVIMGLLGRLTPERSLPVTQGAVYWHFVDLLWIFLLLFLYIIH